MNISNHANELARTDPPAPEYAEIILTKIKRECHVLKAEKRELQATIERLRGIVDNYRHRVKRMQEDATSYLVPNKTTCDVDWFVNRMLWHLDGPEQRAIEATKENDQ